MDATRSSNSGSIVNALRDPIWQGIGGIAAIAALVLPLTIVLWELTTGNLRLLLWLHVISGGLIAIVGALVAVTLAAAYVVVSWQVKIGGEQSIRKGVVRKQHRYSRGQRSWAAVVLLAAVSLLIVVTVGFDVWWRTPQDRTLVLIADFLDSDHRDNLGVTRELTAQIQHVLAGHADIEVRTIGWPIENIRGEGSDVAQRVGNLAKASIVVWGDYRISPELAVFVHFDTLSPTVELLRDESFKIYGDKKVQETALRQVSLPSTVAFNAALGEHLGALVAFAGGLTLLDNGDLQHATQLFDVASQVYGNPLAVEIEPIIHFFRGWAYTLLGDGEAAVPELTTCLTVFSKDSNQGLYISQSNIFDIRGMAYYAAGQPDAAIADYNASIALDPKNANAYNNRAVIFSSKEMQDAAVSDYTTAINLDPTFAGAYLNRGRVFALREEFVAAVADMTRAIELGDSKASAYLSRGHVYLAEGRYDAAISDFNNAIALDPSDSEAYNSRGSAFQDQGRLDSAEADFTKAIEMDPNNGAAFNNRGLIFQSRHQLDLAYADFDRAIQIDPLDPAARYNRGNVYNEQGNRNLALADYNRAIELDPEYPGVYNNRAVILHEQGHKEAAIADFTKTIELAPDDARAYNNRGNIYADLGKLDAAIEDYNKAIAVDPSYAEAQNNLGIAYLHLGQAAAAITAFTSAIELAPQSPLAYYHRASVYEDQGLLDKAITDYTKAVELSPRFALAYCYRGELFKSQGRLSAAVGDFTKCIELAPKYAPAYKSRGSAFADSGRTAEAIADLAHYLEFNPSTSERETIEKQLDVLRTATLAGP